MQLVSQLLYHKDFVIDKSRKGFMFPDCSDAERGDFYGNTKSYNIPVSHLDYKYIEKCTDAKYMEKIVKILK